MAACRKPGCADQAGGGSPYCALHKAGGPNIVLPPMPAKVATQQDLAQARADRAAPPAGLHRRRGAIDLGASALILDGQNKNKERMRVAHATQLAKKVTDLEYMTPLKAAFFEVTQSPGFGKCLDREVGWTNWSSWFDWSIRAIAPEMAMRPVAEELRDQLRSRSLIAGINNKVFADRYFFELSLYCDAAIEKMDISFVYGMASMVFAPILGPIMAVPSAAAKAASGAVAGTATSLAVSAGKSLAGMGVKAGLHAGLVDAPGQKMGAIKKYENLNPMRFTLAWLDYVTSNAEPKKAVDVIVAEFGGAKGCDRLYEWLKSSNL
jgi:hypothetical protein